MKGLELGDCLSKQYLSQKATDWLIVWFYGISTIVRYLMPNLFFISILNMISKHILSINQSFVYTQMQKQFYFQQFSLV